MKKILFYLFIYFTGILLNSCKKNIMDGDWSDNIKLSQKSVQFNSTANSITITTETTNWWLNDIVLNGSSVDLENINIHGKNFEISNPEFQINRKDGNKIIISVPENNLNKERKIIIRLQNGNYFDGIIVSQSK